MLLAYGQHSEVQDAGSVLLGLRGWGLGFGVWGLGVEM